MANPKDIKEWFRFAADDLAVAKNSMVTMWPRPLYIVCFHCQQAAEKYIKGVMTYFDIEVVKIHSLVKLSAMLQDKTDIAPITDACTFLTQYAVAARYPFGPEIDEPVTLMAIAKAQRVKSWAESLVQLDGGTAVEGTQDNAAEHRAQDVNANSRQQYNQ